MGSHEEQGQSDQIQKAFAIKNTAEFIRRTTREKKFCQKIQKLVSQVESSPTAALPF